MKEIKTKRLLLSPRTDAELEALIAAETDEDMRGAYAEMLSLCRRHPEDRLWYTDWKISPRGSGEDMGGIGFKGPPDENGGVEIGYGLNEAYRNRGFATEAAKAMIGRAFSQAGVRFIMAEAAADNAPSLRVIEKLGFSPSGTGKEGPRFSLEKPAASFMGTYMSLGICFGVAFGELFGSLALGISLGTALGFAVGAAMDAQDKRKRAGIGVKRKGAENE